MVRVGTRQKEGTWLNQRSRAQLSAFGKMLEDPKMARGERELVLLK